MGVICHDCNSAVSQQISGILLIFPYYSTCTSPEQVFPQHVKSSEEKKDWATNLETLVSKSLISSKLNLHWQLTGCNFRPCITNHIMTPIS